MPPRFAISPLPYHHHHHHHRRRRRSFSSKILVNNQSSRFINRAVLEGDDAQVSCVVANLATTKTLQPNEWGRPWNCRITTAKAATNPTEEDEESQSLDPGKMDRSMDYLNSFQEFNAQCRSADGGICAGDAFSFKEGIFLCCQS